MEKLSSPIALIKKSFDIFFEKNNLIYFLKIYAWLLPFQLFFLYQNYFVDTQSKLLNSTNIQEIIFKYPWFLVAVILVNLVFMVVSFWVDVAGIKAIIGVVGGKTKTVKETFLFSWKILWPFSLVSILVGIIQVGGLLLLIIPGIIFSVWYGFSKFVFLNQNVGIVESLKESKKLVVGRFWNVFGRTIVFVIFTVICQTIFTLVPFRIGSFITPLFGVLFILPYFLLFKELKD